MLRLDPRHQVWHFVLQIARCHEGYKKLKRVPRVCCRGGCEEEHQGALEKILSGCFAGTAGRCPGKPRKDHRNNAKRQVIFRANASEDCCGSLSCCGEALFARLLRKLCPRDPRPNPEGLTACWTSQKDDHTQGMPHQTASAKLPGPISTKSERTCLVKRIAPVAPKISNSHFPPCKICFSVVDDL